MYHIYKNNKAKLNAIFIFTKIMKKVHFSYFQYFHISIWVAN
jgi:hypothetical protein